MWSFWKEQATSCFYLGEIWHVLKCWQVFSIVTCEWPQASQQVQTKNTIPKVRTFDLKSNLRANAYYLSSFIKIQARIFLMVILPIRTGNRSQSTSLLLVVCYKAIVQNFNCGYRSLHFQGRLCNFALSLAITSLLCNKKSTSYCLMCFFYYNGLRSRFQVTITA